VNTLNRSRRVRQRPRTRRIRRRQDQPLLCPEGDQTASVFRNHKVRAKVQERGQITPYGRLSVAHEQAVRLEIDREISRSMRLLKLHMPILASDHILTHVDNLYVGGRSIEDIATLQHCQAVKHLPGACRIKDPTTARDSLRRFRPSHPRSLLRVIDRAREKV
jgi:hypothetical protein